MKYHIILPLAFICCFFACQNEQKEASQYEVPTSTNKKVKVDDDLRLKNSCIKRQATFEETKENYISYQVDKNGSVKFSGSVDAFAFNGETEKLTDRIRVGNEYFKVEFIVDINCQFVKGVRLTKTGDGEKWDIKPFKLIRS